MPIRRQTGGIVLECRQDRPPISGCAQDAANLLRCQTSDQRMLPLNARTPRRYRPQIARATWTLSRSTQTGPHDNKYHPSDKHLRYLVLNEAVSSCTGDRKATRTITLAFQRTCHPIPNSCRELMGFIGNTDLHILFPRCLSNTL